MSKKLSELEKRFAKSGRRLTDGSGRVKAVGFVGGVRKPDNLPHDAYTTGEFGGEYPEIDLKRAEEDNRQMEQNSPSFRAFRDKLRRAARAVGRDMKMLLVLAFALVSVSKRT